MKGAWETVQDEKGTQAWADIGETYPAAGLWPNHLLCFGQSAAVFSLLLIVSVALSGGQKCLMVITRKKPERLFVVALLPEILSWSAVLEIICVRSTISSCRVNSVNPLNRKEASGVNNFQGRDLVLNPDCSDTHWGYSGNAAASGLHLLDAALPFLVRLNCASARSNFALTSEETNIEINLYSTG